MARQHPLDRREIKAERLPTVESRAREAAQQLRGIRIQLAKDLAAIDEVCAFVYSGCASIAEYGLRIGLDAAEARSLCNAGRAMQLGGAFDGSSNPADGARDGPGPVEQLLVRGDIPLAAAALLGRLAIVEGGVRVGDAWLEDAVRLPLRTLRRRVSARIEETKQAAPGVVELSFHVTERTRARFGRVCVLESRRADQSLTEGQVFTRMVDDHLARNDSMEKTARRRRMPSTSSREDSRGIPAEVRRAIHERAHGQCEVPGCQNGVFLDYCHIVPFRDQAGQEVEDLFLGCTMHHKQFDAGLIRFAGWDDARRPRFETADGEASDRILRCDHVAKRKQRSTRVMHSIWRTPSFARSAEARRTAHRSACYGSTGFSWHAWQMQARPRALSGTSAISASRNVLSKHQQLVAVGSATRAQAFVLPPQWAAARVHVGLPVGV